MAKFKLRGDSAAIYDAAMAETVKALGQLGFESKGKAKPVRKEKPKAGTRKSRGGTRYSDDYAKIALSIGGMGRLCSPTQLSQLKAAGQSPARVVLPALGLTPAKARAVLSAMDRAGVLSHGTGRYRRDKASQAQARQILFEVGGIQCPR